MKKYIFIVIFFIAVAGSSGGCISFVASGATAGIHELTEFVTKKVAEKKEKKEEEKKKEDDGLKVSEAKTLK